MDIKKFDYNKNYNFTGIFWFENEYENRFSGSLDYTPEKGIKLSLISFISANLLDPCSLLFFIFFFDNLGSIKRIKTIKPTTNTNNKNIDSDILSNLILSIISITP